MTKKNHHKIWSGGNLKKNLENVKLGKFSTESENLFGNRGNMGKPET